MQRVFIFRFRVVTVKITYPPCRWDEFSELIFSRNMGDTHDEKTCSDLGKISSRIFRRRHRSVFFFSVFFFRTLAVVEKKICSKIPGKFVRRGVLCTHVWYDAAMRSAQAALVLRCYGGIMCMSACQRRLHKIARSSVRTRSSKRTGAVSGLKGSRPSTRARQASTGTNTST